MHPEQFQSKQMSARSLTVDLHTNLLPPPPPPPPPNPPLSHFLFVNLHPNLCNERNPSKSFVCQVSTKSTKLSPPPYPSICASNRKAVFTVVHSLPLFILCPEQVHRFLPPSERLCLLFTWHWQTGYQQRKKNDKRLGFPTIPSQCFELFSKIESIITWHKKDQRAENSPTQPFHTLGLYGKGRERSRG